MKCHECNSDMSLKQETDRNVHSCPFGCHETVQLHNGEQIETFSIRIRSYKLKVINSTKIVSKIKHRSSQISYQDKLLLELPKLVAPGTLEIKELQTQLDSLDFHLSRPAEVESAESIVVNFLDGYCNENAMIISITDESLQSAENYAAIMNAYNFSSNSEIIPEFELWSILQFNKIECVYSEFATDSELSILEK